MPGERLTQRLKEKLVLALTLGSLAGSGLLFWQASQEAQAQNGSGELAYIAGGLAVSAITGGLALGYLHVRSGES